MLRTMIADDGPEVRVVLRKIISKISGVEVVGEVENGKQLVKMVKELKPDIVFIDIDMPEMKGTEAAEKIFDIDPNIFIVFATGYDNYTHEAFKVYAFDYIMKPFEVERIHQTIDRAKEWKAKTQRLQVIEHLVSQLGTKNLKLKIKSQEQCNIINIEDIVLVTRNDRKTVIFTTGGTYKTYEPLGKIHQRLEGSQFFRCHKGYIINTDRVTELSPWGHKTYLVKLKDTKETALMTIDKAKEFQDKYCME